VGDSRRYQRYALSYDGVTHEQFEMAVDGEPVHLVDFSVGGLRILSKLPFSLGPVNLSISFEQGGNIDLNGVIVRARKEGEMWEIAIDLSKTYNLHTLQKV
jgi:hypothetical protein